MVTYYLRSTVLNGQIIEELNNSGAKQQAYVYMGNKLIGQQFGPNGDVLMMHGEPSGVNVRQSGPASNFQSPFSEMDPWGAEVYGSDPYLADPQFSGGRGEGGPLFPGVGDISMPSTGCSMVLDGILTLCDFVNRNFNSGAIQKEYKNADGTTQRLPIDVVLGAARVEQPRYPSANVDPEKPEGPPGSEFLDGVGVTTIPFKDSNADCSIEVRFAGTLSSGTPQFADGPDHTTLGEYTGQLTVANTPVTKYEFRFEVVGSVNDGAIGRIGDPQKETSIKLGNGGWQIGQQKFPFPTGNRNGNPLPDAGVTTDDSPRNISGEFQNVAVHGREFGWHDSPGLASIPENELKSGEFKSNFIVYAQNGTRRCSVAFHIVGTYSDGTWTAKIVAGLLR